MEAQPTARRNTHPSCSHIQRHRVCPFLPDLSPSSHYDRIRSSASSYFYANWTVIHGFPVLPTPVAYPNTPLLTRSPLPALTHSPSPPSHSSLQDPPLAPPPPSVHFPPSQHDQGAIPAQMPSSASEQAPRRPTPTARQAGTAPLHSTHPISVGPVMRPRWNGLAAMRDGRSHRPVGSLVPRRTRKTLYEVA